MFSQMFLVECIDFTFLNEGNEIAKTKGNLEKKSYHAGVTGKDKLAYDKIIELLKSGKSVMDIHCEMEVAQNTIYTIQSELFKVIR